jgi:hypothetical protein
MANYNYLDFFRIPSPTDTKLSIKDIDGNIVYSLSPFKIELSIAFNNTIKIIFVNGDSIIIDFNDPTEAKTANANLLHYLNILRNKKPTTIDKDIQLYVDNAVAGGGGGTAGVPGGTGPQGPLGPAGSTGSQGPIGPQGVQGDLGPIGPAGLMWRGLWNSSNSYSVNDSVGYASASWFCIGTISSVSAPDTDHTHWALLAAQGAPGQQGTQGDQGSIGPRGATGPQGSQGSGVQGPTGPQGVQGGVGPQGYIGPTGSQGDKSGLQYYFDTTTTGGVGTSGSIRFNNSSISSVGNLYINKLDINGSDFSGFISLWSNSTTSIRGFVSIKENNNASSIHSIFAVIGNVVDNSTYYTVPVSYISGSIPSINDRLAIDFDRSGRDGVIGATGSQGNTGATGPQGNTGATGIGVTGSQGPQGAKGATGNQGPIGDQGAQGDFGPTGATGTQGPQGNQGQTGPKGATGNQGPIGIQGDQGATGPIGQLGPTGPVGPQGVQGPKGNTGSQGPTGSVGPQGDQGAMGITGPQGLVGAQGNQGAVGAKGATGNQGPIGVQGDQGATGPIGPLGPTGPVGPQGIQGPKGNTGSQGPTGPVGPQGDFGPTGSQGLVGIQGPTGPQGAVGMGIPGPIGPQGAVGLGATGPQGDQGIIGPIGPTGSQGPQGTQGFKGVTGSQGATGSQGDQGIAGPIGSTGSQGPQGTQGFKGATGPIGPTGSIGSTGPQGATGVGATGSTGATGPQGVTGPQGINGILGGTGPTGPQGATGIAGATGPQGAIGVTGANGPQGVQGADGAQGPGGLDNANILKWTFDGLASIGGMSASDTTLTSITSMIVNNIDVNTINQFNWHNYIYTWLSTNPNKAILQIRQSNDTTIMATYVVSSLVSSGSTWIYNLTNISGNGSITISQVYSISWVLDGADGIGSTASSQSLDQVLTVGNTSSSSIILYDNSSSLIQASISPSEISVAGLTGYVGIYYDDINGIGLIDYYDPISNGEIFLGPTSYSGVIRYQWIQDKNGTIALLSDTTLDSVLSMSNSSTHDINLYAPSNLTISDTGSSFSTLLSNDLVAVNGPTGAIGIIYDTAFSPKPSIIYLDSNVGGITLVTTATMSGSTNIQELQDRSGTIALLSDVIGDKYLATSNTTISVPIVGATIELSTQPSLSYTVGQTVLISGTFSESFYGDIFYTEDFELIPIIQGEIEFYDYGSGTMSVIVISSRSVGYTASFWTLNLGAATNDLNPLPITYSDLYNLYINGYLTATRYYLITDFQTVYDQPDFYYNIPLNLNKFSPKTVPDVNTKSGSIEPLLVYATSTQSISTEAISITYPHDKIKYDISWNTTEINGSTAYGRITERISKENIRTDYDWRNVLYRRYEIGTTASLLTGTVSFDLGLGLTLSGVDTLFTSQLVNGDLLYFNEVVGTVGGLTYSVIDYKIKVDTIIDDTTLTLYYPSTNYLQTSMSNTNLFKGLTSTGIYGNFAEDYPGQVSFGGFIDTPTVGTGSSPSVTNVYIGDYFNYLVFVPFVLSNNVFTGNVFSIKTLDVFLNNTFLNTVAGCNFDALTVNNLFLGQAEALKIGYDMTCNIFAGNVLGLDSKFGLSNNIFLGNITETSIGTGVLNNLFSTIYAGNIGNNVMYNKFSSIHQVSIGNGIQYVDFTTISNPPSLTFSGNIISNSFTKINTLGHNISDKFGQVALLTGGTVSVTDTQIQSTSIIILTPIGSGIGLLSVNNYVGTGFMISSSDISDTRTINYMIHY